MRTKEGSKAGGEGSGGPLPAVRDARPAARDVRSDVLKAAAIVGVVAIHASWPYAEILRFGVPVFIAIWAYYYERGLASRSGAKAWSYAGRRFVRLLVPYFFWTLLYLVLFHNGSEWRTTPRHTIVGGWFGGYGWPGQYFFVILFQLVWLVPLLRRFVRPAGLWIAAAVGALLNAVADYWLFRNPIVAGLGDRMFVYWLVYVVLGIAFARGYPRRNPLFLLAAVALLLGAPLETGLAAEHNERASVYLLPTVTLGSIALLLATAARAPAVSGRQDHARRDHARRDPVRRDFVRRGATGMVLAIGRNSFAIFVCNPLILCVARRIGCLSDDSHGGLLTKALVIGAALAGSIAIASLARRLKLGILVGG